MTNLAKLEHLLMIGEEYKEIVNSAKIRLSNCYALSMLAPDIEIKEPVEPDYETVAANFIARIAATLEVPNE